MRIGVLGPLELAVDGRAVPVGGRRLRILLGVLALDAPRPVSLDRLADVVWDGDAPSGARNALQTLVSRARRVLADGGVADPTAVLSQSPGGYALEAPAHDVDAHRFAALVQSGRDAVRSGDLAHGTRQLGEALALWRGPLLADAPDAPEVLAARARWEQLQLAAWEARLGAQLQLAAQGSGDIAEPIAALSALTSQHPLHEGFAVLLLDGLAAAGRAPEALEAYEQIRGTLADQLGIDPPRPVQEAYLRLLRDPEPAMLAPMPGLLPVPLAEPSPEGASSADRVSATDEPASASAPLRRPPLVGVRAQVSTFVGREADRRAIVELLRRRRMVTMVGAGGAGKTRLASEVAAAIAVDPAVRFDGVWMAELAGIGAGAESSSSGVSVAAVRPGGVEMLDVAEALLATLDIGESRLIDRRVQVERSALDRLVDALADRRDLIILDNCEHLIDAAASLADHLLARCSALRVLATSREPLSIDGESVYPVAPLALPEPDAAVDPAALLECPSVRLFVDRAVAARPSFVLDDRSAEAVVQICRRLDGLPLALELAAARLRTLSVQHIAQRLSDRFALLTSGSRTALPRHRTLHAVVAWSWDLLDASQRRVLESLAVFAGGISPEAAARVCGRDAPMIDELADLAEKSLLSILDGPAPRFRMLETIREFGIEQLRSGDGEGSPNREQSWKPDREPGGEPNRGPGGERNRKPDREAEARAAHAGFFADVARETAPRILRAGQLEAIELLGLERDNLFAALQELSSTGQAQRAVELALDLSWSWMLTGAHTVASAWARVALESDGPVSDAEWAAAQVMYGVNSMALGWHWLAEPGFLRARRILAEADPRTQAPMGLIMRIMCAIFTGQETEALYGDSAADAATIALLRADADGVDELMEAAIAGDDPWVRAAAQLMRGSVAENGGEVRTAIRAYRDALERFEVLGERWGAGNALDGLSRALIVEGDLPNALVALQRSMQAMEELGAQDDVAQSLCWMAQLRLRLGEADMAERALAEAIERFERTGSPFGPILTRAVGADIAWHRGDIGDALRLFREARELTEEAGAGVPPQLRSLSLGMAAALRALPGDHQDLPVARRDTAAAFELAEASGDIPVVATMAVIVALLLVIEGDAGAAARAFGAARSVRGALDPTNAICIDVQRRLDAAGAVGTPTRGIVARELAAGEQLSRGEAIAELRQLVDRLAGSAVS